MDITLKIDGIDKKFKTDFISASLIKDTIKLAEDYSNVSSDSLDAEMFDTMADYITKVFNNKFTSEQLMGGLDIGQLVPKFQESIKTIMDKFGAKMKELSDLNQ